MERARGDLYLVVTPQHEQPLQRHSELPLSFTLPCAYPMTYRRMPDTRKAQIRFILLHNDISQSYIIACRPSDCRVPVSSLFQELSYGEVSAPQRTPFLVVHRIYCRP